MWRPQPVLAVLLAAAALLTLPPYHPHLFITRRLWTVPFMLYCAGAAPTLPHFQQPALLCNLQPALLTVQQSQGTAADMTLIAVQLQVWPELQQKCGIRQGMGVSTCDGPACKSTTKDQLLGQRRSLACVTHQAITKTKLHSSPALLTPCARPPDSLNNPTLCSHLQKCAGGALRPPHILFTPATRSPCCWQARAGGASRRYPAGRFCMGFRGQAGSHRLQCRSHCLA